MTEQQKGEAIKIVQNTINFIAAKEYEKLAQVTMIDESWCGEAGTQISGIKEFGKWLDEQLEMWSEDEGKDFVIDKFDEGSLEIEQDRKGVYFAAYYPKSHNETLDFWFEFRFFKNKQGELLSEFNVNV